MSIRTYPYHAYWNALLIGTPLPTEHPSCKTVFPVLISIRQWNGMAQWRDRVRFHSTLTSYISENLFQDNTDGDCIQMDEGHYLLLFADLETSGQHFLHQLESLIEWSRTGQSVDLSCVIGKSIEPELLNTITDQLASIDNENVRDLSILSIDSPVWDSGDIDHHLVKWQDLLTNEEFDRVLLDIQSFFLNEGHSFRAETLYRFNQSFIQALYVVMAEKKVPAQALFTLPTSAACFRDAPNSIANTLTWIHYAVTAFSEFLIQRSNSQNYVQQVMDYIQAHISSNFSRQDIADSIHLSQNHLARLFRQATGMSIAEYIVQERMKLAMRLLKNTTMSVSDIALQTGYENYTYFLTVFRRAIGMTPSQYRAEYLNSISKGDHSNG